MSKSRNIASRVKDILTKDKVGVKEGFSTLLHSDLKRILGDYFELCDDIKIKITIDEEGLYDVEIKGVASGIKEFSTTLDIKRF